MKLLAGTFEHEHAPSHKFLQIGSVVVVSGLRVAMILQTIRHVLQNDTTLGTRGRVKLSNVARQVRFVGAKVFGEHLFRYPS